jgi:Holliday junction resolvase
MLNTLTNILDRTDDQYLRPEHLGQLTNYSQSFQERSELYTKLQKLEPKILNTVLKQTGLNDTASIQEITLMLRTAAMAMLLDDPIYLKEHYLDWLVSQALAFGSQARLHRQATLLQQALTKQLPAEQMVFIRPALDTICQSLL